jgi:carbon-monoxide dehydrogenase small subunit
VQRGFMECHGLQCGFCTPGMMMTARALLDRNPDPSEGEIREAISGQICRCTGYSTIVRSIRWAAAEEAGTRTTIPDDASAIDQDTTTSGSAS